MVADDSAPADPSSRTYRLLLLLVLSLSAFIQFTVVSRTIADVPIRADASEYFSYAYNLHNFGVYSIQKTWTLPPETSEPVPDKLRSPGYPLFLLATGVPEPTSTYLRRVTMVQAALGVLSVLLTYLIAVNFLTRPLALAVALLAAINPSLATISTYLLSESLFLFLLLAGVLSLIRSIRDPVPWKFFATGLVWGLCALARPTMEFLPWLLFIAVFIVPSWRRFAKPGAIAIAGFLLVASPWIIRNLSVEQPGASLMIKTLAHGSYPNFMYDNKPESFGFPYRFDPDAAENSKDLGAILHHIADRFENEPATYFRWYLLGKPYFFLSLENVQSWDIFIYPVLQTPYADDARFEALREVGLKVHWPLVFLALLGIALLAHSPLWRSYRAGGRTAAGIVGLVIVYAIGFHMIAAPFPRYSIPFRPLIFALAAIPVQALWLRLTNKPSQTD